MKGEGEHGLPGKNTSRFKWGKQTDQTTVGGISVGTLYAQV